VKKPSIPAQGTTEYALILALVVLVVLVIVAVFGKQIAAAYQTAVGGLRSTPAAPVATSASTNVPTITPIPRSIPTIAQDFKPASGRPTRTTLISLPWA
jgi:Flp pilus assembly pilin Flp